MTGTNRHPLPILKMPSPNKGSLWPSIPEETNSKLSLQRLVVLLGPTAVGKSELAIQLAEQLNGEIISADSPLFYRGMDIGTAKPSSADRQRIPHHLIDVANPDQTWSLGVFQQQARRAIQDVNDRGKLPFLVGGTGQYIWAVVEGWQVPPVQPDPHLRDALLHWADEIGPVELHHRLEIIDASTAAIRAFTSSTCGRRTPMRRVTSPGAVHLPRGQLELRFDSMFPDPTVRILAYCEFGKISTIAAGTLHTMGFLGAIALDGGIRAWREAGYPLEAGPPATA